MRVNDSDPGSSESGVLVALHGHGDDPESARAWGAAIAPHGWEVVAPGARLDETGTRSWFSTGPRGANDEDLLASARQIRDLIEPILRRGTRVVISGYSQGAALAMTLPSLGITATATISICGFYPEVQFSLSSGESPVERVAGDGNARNASPAPVLILNASDDEVVPAFLGADAAAMLSADGIKPTVQVLPGDHRVGAQLTDAARLWLDGALGSSIKISLGLPVERVQSGPELISADAMMVLAAGYERLGFHAAYVTDHPAPDDKWLAGGGHQALEPTVALAFAAAATQRLKLHTNVYVLPYRNPFMAAKSLASIDVLSGGRLIAGVAAGYVRPEFAALGVDFKTRGQALEESLKMLPRIWTETSVADSGQGWTARGVTALPQPSTPPPIWVGGNSSAALRRALQFAQGWSPMPTPPGSGKGLRTTEITSIDELATRMADIPALSEKYGRTEPLTVCFVPFSLGGYLNDPDRGLEPLLREAAELAEIGVDWLALGVPGETRDQVLLNASQLSAGLQLS